jgi:hypothetical protein
VVALFKPMMGKTSNPGDSRRLGECGEFEEHKGVSVHPLRGLVEEEGRRRGLSAVSSSGGSNGADRVLERGRRRREWGAVEFL